MPPLLEGSPARPVADFSKPMKWLTDIQPLLTPLFAEKPIVLVDVGASGEPPQEWRALAPLACYVGFDPDSRAIREDNSFGFRRFVMLNRAVTETDSGELEFFLTASPYCSSSLRPNFATLAEYSFTDLFQVERTAKVPATSLPTALAEARIASVDWLKLDTQGKDLDLFRSLAGPIERGLLVLDIEPGMVDFYEGENTFAPAHSYLLEHGWWLARGSFQKYPRSAKRTREALGGRVDFDALPGNPTAIEAQYFRTTQHLAENGTTLRDLACLWIFAMQNRNFGFALDLAVIAGKSHDAAIGEALVKATIGEIERRKKRPASFAKKFALAWIPAALHPLIKRLIGTAGDE